jgi:transcriptional regulator with XRE-family HTH domain
MPATRRNPLRAARIRADLTQVELARISGVGRNTIARLESVPASHVPHATTQRALAIALGCRPAELFPVNGTRKARRLGTAHVSAKASRQPGGNRLRRLHGYTNGTVPADRVPAPEGLVADVTAFIRAYVVMSERQLLILALWVIHTHAFGVAEQTPYLNVSSPEKRCGKTGTLEVAGLLVRDPVFTANTSPSALFRTIAATRPTLLMDETDATFGKQTRPGERSEDLRGILNVLQPFHSG